MPTKPRTIKASQLESILNSVLPTLESNPMQRLKGPLINGIIIDESKLGGAKPLDLAKDIIGRLGPAGGADLLPVAKPLGGKMVLVGFRNPNMP